ncbi:hypothetical protein [Methylobacterium sp. J-068]|jgi:hypothetical protein|uniref:hypothetical protein n=1 Tax=Methylobacterium sp. J-068 TaxID=2836649 RepID=UPI001FBB3DD3|nr:hypothetical protein [Methylobacterium sp. J-068]MCJ2034587.1 hypothetical protein [Methylobacterium sp. J-068]
MRLNLPHWLADRLMPWRFRREARAKASDLIAAYGPLAYSVAREEARKGARGRRDRFWTAVAIAIAEIEGREIGVSGADRWGAPDMEKSGIRYQAYANDKR